MPTHEEIIATLDKLFRLGEHPTTNPHEAANALALAQAILLKHNLSRAQVTNQEKPVAAGIGKVHITNDTGHVWKTRLLGVIARASLCRVVNDSSHKTANLFGTHTNVMAVIRMYNWVVPELEIQAMKEYREYKNDEGTESSRTWRAAFFDGAIIAIKDRLQPPVTEFANNSGRDIVLANAQRLDEAVHKIFPSLRRTRYSIHSQNDGFNTGKQAGSSIRFGPQGTLAAGSRALPPGH